MKSSGGTSRAVTIKTKTLIINTKVTNSLNMAFELPQLDSELRTELEVIIQNKTFDESKSQLQWNDGILPKLITRLNELAALSKDGDRFGNPKGIDFIAEIGATNETITHHLAEQMSSSPPFTIHRLAELIVDPNSQGYTITNNDQLFKYFNSLKKVCIVSSRISEFPPVRIGNETNGHDKKESIGLVAENVSLVEIPWLKTSKKDEVTHATINDSPPLKRKGEEEDCIVPKKGKS